MGSYRSARRQTRAYEFGRRHPRLTVVIVGVALAGVIAVCAFQIRHGAYLGRGWAIAASAGMATAAVLGAAALINSKRHSPALGRFRMAWLVLGLLSTSSIGYPWAAGPRGPAGGYGCAELMSTSASVLGRICPPRRQPGRRRRSAPRRAR